MLPSPSPEAVTPHRGVPEATGPASLREDRPADSKNLGEIKDEAFTPAGSGGVQSTVTAAAASVKNAIPSQANLQAQLEEAKAQIARLTKQVGDSSGLRQRKTESANNPKAPLSTAVDAREAPAGGVPIHITALLCLISFLLAYFLF